MAQGKKSPYTTETGKRILLRRKSLGWTQERAAEEAGLSTHFYATVETGLSDTLSENIVKIARALQVSTDYILTGQPSTGDRDAILSMIEPLKGLEYSSLLEIVRNYVIGCGYPDPLLKTEKSKK